MGSEMEKLEDLVLRAQAKDEDAYTQNRDRDSRTWLFLMPIRILD